MRKFTFILIIFLSIATLVKAQEEAPALDNFIFFGFTYRLPN